MMVLVGKLQQSILRRQQMQQQLQPGAEQPVSTGLCFHGEPLLPRPCCLWVGADGGDLDGACMDYTPS